MGKKTFFIHSYFVFLFGGKFRCKPHSMYVTNSVRITAYSKLSACTLFSFPFSFELLV